MLVMATMRTYGDGCGIAHALDLVGERWALLVVRELLLGPKRFTDLRDGLPNSSPNVLSQRLRELEQAAIVQRRKLPPPAGSWIYELTDWGRELKPIVISLGSWAAPLAVLSLATHPSAATRSSSRSAPSSTPRPPATSARATSCAWTSTRSASASPARRSRSSAAPPTIRTRSSRPTT